MSQPSRPWAEDTSEARSAWSLRGGPVGWVPFTHSNIPQVNLPCILFFPALYLCPFLIVCFGEMPAYDIIPHKEGSFSIPYNY